MNILKILRVKSDHLTLNGEEWNFPYMVYDLIELSDRIIVSFNWSHLEKNPPSPDFYMGCNIWCYDKKSKAVLWIIEEPPSVYGPNGEDLGKIRGFSNYFPDMRIDECYLGVDGAVIDGETRIFAHTTGCREFLLNPKDGSVKLTRTDLR